MALSSLRHAARFNLLQVTVAEADRASVPNASCFHEADYASTSQLETGEKFLTDVAVMHSPPTPATHHPLPHVKGRLHICSASLVFDPALEDVPLLRIPLGKVTCIEPARASGWNVAALLAGGSEARFRVQCSSLISMLADKKPGPYKVACDLQV